MLDDTTAAALDVELLQRLGLFRGGADFDTLFGAGVRPVWALDARDRCIARGLLVEHGDRLTLTPRGLVMSRTPPAPTLTGRSRR